MSVFKYYLITQILTLVFKYHAGVFKYLTIAYNNHLVKKICIVINYVHCMTSRNYQKIRQMSKIF